MQVIFDKEIENLNSLVKLRKSIKKLEKELSKLNCSSDPSGELEGTTSLPNP